MSEIKSPRILIEEMKQQGYKMFDNNLNETDNKIEMCFNNEELSNVNKYILIEIDLFTFEHKILLKSFKSYCF